MMDFLNLTPDSLKLIALRIALALIIYVVGHLIIKYTVKLIIKFLHLKGIDKGLFKFAESVTRITLSLVLFLTCCVALGININPILTALGGVLLAMALAVKDSLSNLTSGIFIIGTRPFAHDDYVEMCGISGSIKEIGLVHTVVMTSDNKKILVPNADICKSTITNYSSEEFRRLDLLFPIAYGKDWHQAQQIITSVASAHDKLKPPTVPEVIVPDFGENTVNLTCRMWVYSSTFLSSQYELNEKIRTLLDDSGLTVPFLAKLNISLDGQNSQLK